MIECVFTIDYEIYGNGQGDLFELVYEPTEKLKNLFVKYNSKFVNFVEAAELEMIESFKTDPAISNVIKQIKDLHDNGFEIGLHLHPQWYNAKYHNGSWELDYSQYNLCVLSEKQIEDTIDRSLNWIQNVVKNQKFCPNSFNSWKLAISTDTADSDGRKEWILLDSSVFKGGHQHKYNLDYRKSLRNGYYWKISDDVNLHDPQVI